MIHHGGAGDTDDAAMCGPSCHAQLAARLLAERGEDGRWTIEPRSGWRYVTARVVSCTPVQVRMSDQNRFNIQLDGEHAAKLRRLAARTHVNPGTLARSLLATALDSTDPDAASIVSILDSIPGAFERAQEGLGQIRSGKGVPLSEL